MSIDNEIYLFLYLNYKRILNKAKWNQNKSIMCDKNRPITF